MACGVRVPTASRPRPDGPGGAGCRKARALRETPCRRYRDGRRTDPGRRRRRTHAPGRRQPVTRSGYGEIACLVADGTIGRVAVAEVHREADLGAEFRAGRRDFLAPHRGHGRGRHRRRPATVRGRCRCRPGGELRHSRARDTRHSGDPYHATKRFAGRRGALGAARAASRHRPRREAYDGSGGRRVHRRRVRTVRSATADRWLPGVAFPPRRVFAQARSTHSPGRPATEVFPARGTQPLPPLARRDRLGP